MSGLNRNVQLPEGIRLCHNLAKGCFGAAKLFVSKGSGSNLEWSRRFTSCAVAVPSMEAIETQNKHYQQKSKRTAATTTTHASGTKAIQPQIPYREPSLSNLATNDTLATKYSQTKRNDRNPSEHFGRAVQNARSASISTSANKFQIKNTRSSNLKSAMHNQNSIS